jgi:hypothetical protein
MFTVADCIDNSAEVLGAIGITVRRSGRRVRDRRGS